MSNAVLKTIHAFFDPGGPGHGETRRHARERFYRPAKITAADGVEYRAFTRDISRNGVGLLHDDELMPGLVRIEIDLRTGMTAEVAAELLWCCPQSNHYISGARFLEEFLQ